MIEKFIVIAIITFSFDYVVIRPNLAAKPTKKKARKAAKQNKPAKPKQRRDEQYVRAYIDGKEVYIPIKQIQQ